VIPKEITEVGIKCEIGKQGGTLRTVKRTLRCGLNETGIFFALGVYTNVE